MKATANALFSAALLASSTVAHVALKAPTPDKALTAGSSNAPPGCKLLLSDKGFPEDAVWQKAFPGVFRKLKGTEGPDYMVQATTVEHVQAAVNFAREHNIRLTVITTGHDFGGRETGRSGLRLDMAALREPTVFSADWTCGKSLKPRTTDGVHVDAVEACPVDKLNKRDVGKTIPQRGTDVVFFEKRDGVTCDQHFKLQRIRKLAKRQTASSTAMAGHSHGGSAPAGTAMAGHAHGGSAAAPTSTAMAGHSHGGSASAPAAGHAHGGSAPAAAPSAGSGSMAGHAHGGSGGAAPTESGMMGEAAGGHSHADGGHGGAEVPGFNTLSPKPTKPAYARIAAGMYNELFFTQADANGLMTAGAQHGGVSVLGGWMQAGGHNPFANKIGMMVDNVMEIEVVTADGKFQKVSACNNPELYWALRGGGGSTFGVVTGATVKVHPTFPVTVTRFFVNGTAPGINQAQAHFLQQGAKLRDTYGLQGYFYMYTNSFQSVLHMPGEHATLENAKKATEPLMKEMEKLAGGAHIEPKYYQYKSYKDWYIAEMGDEEMEETGAKYLSWYDGSDGSVPSSPEAMMNPLVLLPWSLKYPQSPSKRSPHDPNGEPEAGEMEGMGHGGAGSGVPRSQAMSRTYLDSRLLSDKHVNSKSLAELATIVNATFPNVPAQHVRGFLYGGGEMAKPAKDAMGLLPAWRDMTYHYIINAVPGNIRHDYDIKALATAFPDAGGYVNEAAPGDANWKKTYWGSNYAKLEQIKKKVDPSNVFWCSPCVGADMLTYDDERLCKNAKYPQAGPAPQTYPNKESKTGIASLPGTAGIPNPMTKIAQAYMANGTLPKTMPTSEYFKIAMGDGGSAGGMYKDMDPYTGKKVASIDSLWLTNSTVTRRAVAEPLPEKIAALKDSAM